MASFRALACPTTSPATTVRLPIASKTGCAFSSSPAGPDARTTSAPSWAGFFVPSTGASTICPPAASAIRRAPSGPTVLAWIHTASGPRAPTISPVTASTASVSKSTVTTASLPDTASATDPAAVTPSPATASALAAVRFQTTTSWPSRASEPAMPAPMIPVPMTATRMAPLCQRPEVLRVGHRHDVPHDDDRGRTYVVRGDVVADAPRACRGRCAPPASCRRTRSRPGSPRTVRPRPAPPRSRGRSRPPSSAPRCRAAGRGRPSRPASPRGPGGRWPETTVKSCATPRCVTGMPATAGTASGLLIPGTTVTGTPAAWQATTSS